MLDIYLAKKNNTRVDLELNHLGSLTMEETKNLRCVFLHPSGLGRVFHFYEDREVSREQVSQLLEICLTCFELSKGSATLIDETYRKIISMLETAAEKQEGIRTVCD